MSEIQQHKLLLDTDFDGTAVEKYGMKHWRNWTKWPLSMREGYDEFLAGFEDGGGRIGKILTIRKGAWYITRKTATRSTIKRQPGLKRHFTNDSVVFAGNEENKAQSLIERAESVVGGYAFIDDKPHKIGVEILKQFSSRAERFAGRIVLGAVQTSSRPAHLDKLTRAALEIDSVGLIDYEDGNTGYKLGEAELVVVALGKYTRQSGKDFAELVEDY